MSETTRKIVRDDRDDPMLAMSVTRAVQSHVDEALGRDLFNKMQGLIGTMTGLLFSATTQILSEQDIDVQAASEEKEGEQLHLHVAVGVETKVFAKVILQQIYAGLFVASSQELGDRTGGLLNFLSEEDTAALNAACRKVIARSDDEFWGRVVWEDEEPEEDSPLQKLKDMILKSGGSTDGTIH